MNGNSTGRRRPAPPPDAPPDPEDQKLGQDIARRQWVRTGGLVLPDLDDLDLDRLGCTLEMAEEYLAAHPPTDEELEDSYLIHAVEHIAAINRQVAEMRRLGDQDSPELHRFFEEFFEWTRGNMIRRAVEIRYRREHRRGAQ